MMRFKNIIFIEIALILKAVNHPTNSGGLQ